MICRPARTSPGRSFFGYILMLLKYGAFSTTHRFRRKHARQQVVFKSAMGKMIAGSVGSFHVLSENNLIYYSKNQSDLHFRRGSPYFSICCLINSCFHEQLLRQSVLIFFIYVSTRSRGLSQFLFHEITTSWHTHQTIRLDELV